MLSSDSVRPEGTLLVDSGADDHICHPSIAEGSPSTKSDGMVLIDVQERVLSHRSTRHDGR